MIHLTIFLVILQLGNPWEIPRLGISYPIKFFGEVVEDSDGKKQWVHGEDIRAVAYDLPIPGYKTTNTINLRLWSTTVPAEKFDLRAFNSGNHEEASRAHANAAKVRQKSVESGLVVYLFELLSIENGQVFISLSCFLAICFLTPSRFSICVCRFAIFFILVTTPRRGKFYD